MASRSCKLLSPRLNGDHQGRREGGKGEERGRGGRRARGGEREVKGGEERAGQGCYGG